MGGRCFRRFLRCWRIGRRADKARAGSQPARRFLTGADRIAKEQADYESAAGCEPAPHLDRSNYLANFWDVTLVRRGRTLPGVIPYSEGFDRIQALARPCALGALRTRLRHADVHRVFSIALGVAAPI